MPGHSASIRGGPMSAPARREKAPPIDQFSGESSDVMFEDWLQHWSEQPTGMGGVVKRNCCSWLATYVEECCRNGTCFRTSNGRPLMLPWIPSDLNWTLGAESPQHKIFATRCGGKLSQLPTTSADWNRCFDWRMGRKGCRQRLETYFYLHSSKKDYGMAS